MKKVQELVPSKTDLFKRLKDTIQNLIVLMKKAPQPFCHPHFKSTGLHVSAVDQRIHPGWQCFHDYKNPVFIHLCLFHLLSFGTRGGKE